MFKLKHKKCNKCMFHFKTKMLDCCYRPDKYGLEVLRPKRIICFKYKEREGK